MSEKIVRHLIEYSECNCCTACLSEYVCVLACDINAEAVAAMDVSVYIGPYSCCVEAIGVFVSGRPCLLHVPCVCLMLVLFLTVLG